MTFSPNGSSATLSATTSTSRVALPTLNVSDVSGNNPTKPYGRQMRVVASADCYIKFGDSSVVATTDDVLLKANVIEVFDINLGGHTHVAGITASGSATVEISGGDGEGAA